MNEQLKHFEEQKIDLEESIQRLLTTKNINNELLQLKGKIEAMTLPLQDAMNKNQQWQYNFSLYCPNNVYNKYQDKIEALTAIYRTICPEHHENQKQSNKEENKYKKVLEKVKQLQEHYLNLDLPQLIDKAKFLIISQQNLEKTQKISTLGFIITELIDLNTQYRKQMEEAKIQYQQGQLLIKNLQQKVKMHLAQLLRKEKYLSEILESINHMLQSINSQASSIRQSMLISDRSINKAPQEANKYDHRSFYSHSSLSQSQQQKIHFKEKLPINKAVSLHRLPSDVLSSDIIQAEEVQIDIEFQWCLNALKNSFSYQSQSSRYILPDFLVPTQKMQIQQPNKQEQKQQLNQEQLNISDISEIDHKISERQIKSEKQLCLHHQPPELSQALIQESAKEPIQEPINHRLQSFPDKLQNQPIIQNICFYQAFS